MSVDRCPEKIHGVSDLLLFMEFGRVDMNFQTIVEDVR
jgi:hypothetical protein